LQAGTPAPILRRMNQQADTGERIAKVLARVGVGSRREVERMVAAGRVAIDGRVLDTPAVNISRLEGITVDGKPVTPGEPARLWRYHKPAGLVTSHRDPQGRPTVFERLPGHLPRVVSVGRLDLASEGLLLLTNDGTLARKMELPETGWTRRYKVRVHGRVGDALLAALAAGPVVDSIAYAPIQARVERAGNANTWLAVTLTEGKNREIRHVLGAFGLTVNRLIRIAFGPFTLGKLPRGAASEVPRKVIMSACGDLLAETDGSPALGAGKTPNPARWAKAKPRKPPKPGARRRKSSAGRKRL